MTAHETLLRRRAPLFALSALLMGGACGGDKKHNPHADKDAGMQVDAGDGDGDTNQKPDAGGDGDSGMQGPETCGPTDKICGGATPACVNGECVECSSSETSQCAANEGCDATTHTCVRNAPFALDCADLPTDGACHGGPREVLLVQDATGLVVMLDPEDGHYLGVFKRPIASYDGPYFQATQGPDQCIWTTQDGERGVERWDTDGSFKDQIIAPKVYYDGQDDLVQRAHGLAFAKDYAYVAFRDGNPHDRLVRFKLDGLTAGKAGDHDVVLDDGTIFDSVIVLGDESLVLTNDESVVAVPAGGGKATPVLTGLMSFSSSAQINYAGGGEILTASYEGSMFKVELASGKTQEVTPFEGDQLNIQGVAALGNGKWLFAADSGALEVLDPASKNPTGQHKTVLPDGSLIARYHYVGRACLSNEFVTSHGPKTEDSCAAPAGDVVFSENFDDGKDFTGSGAQRNYNGFFERPNANVTVSIDTSIQGAENSTGSLKVNGAPKTTDADGDHEDPSTPSGVAHALTDLKPSYISYYVRLDVDTAWAGYFCLNTYQSNPIEYVYFDSNGSGPSHVTTRYSNVSSPNAVAKQWMHVQMRNINWTDRTYDLYVDCKRVAQGIQFSLGGDAAINSLQLFNYWPTDMAWFDQIVMSK